MSQTACAATKEQFTNFDLMVSIYDSGIATEFNLKSSALTVLNGLSRYYNHKSGVVYPSIETLACKLNLGERTVTRAVKELIDKKLILRVKTKKGNVYSFTNVFWESIKKDASKSNQVTCQKIKPTRQNVQSRPASLTAACHEQNKHDQNNKTGQIFNFQKVCNNSTKSLQYNNEKFAKEQKYPSIEETKRALKEKEDVKRGSPLDYTYEEAIDFLNGLLPELKNSYFATELRKKWGLNKECRHSFV